MQVEHYTPERYSEVAKLVTEFHWQYMRDQAPVLDSEVLEETIKAFQGENARNSFLLIMDGICVGVIAGIEVQSRVNRDMIFQEMFFYVTAEFGRYAFWFIDTVKAMLKDSGVKMLVMSVVESRKHNRIAEIYKTMGFKYLESHFVTML